MKIARLRVDLVNPDDRIADLKERLKEIPSFDLIQANTEELFILQRSADYDGETFMGVTVEWVRG